MSLKRLLPALFFAAVLIHAALAQTATPEPLTMPTAVPDPVQAAEVAEAARAALVGQNQALRTAGTSDRVRAGDISIRDGWAFGLLTVRAPDDVHAEPDLHLFLSHYRDGAWQTYLEDTPEFDAALHVIPTGVMPEAARSMMAQREMLTRSTGANIGLPYAIGETWTLTGGPHPNGAGTNSRPWSAIDMAYPGAAAGQIRAAEGGVAWVPTDCPNLIRIDHPGGWRTGYYHVINIRIGNGQVVQRGQWLADEGAATGCGGFATGPHVHLSLRRYDPNAYGYPNAQTFVNIAGSVFGGWQVLDGSSPYQGCMRRVRDGYTVCAGNGQVNYENPGGPVPTDIPAPTAVGPTPTPNTQPGLDRRLDFNRDGYPDLWLVDMRPDDGGDTTVSIYNGRNPTQLLHFKQTTLPPQPVELNTAFAAGDFNSDGTPDLWLFHRRMDVSGTTALRILDIRGEIVYDLLWDTPTALPPLTDRVSFAVGDYNRDNRLDIYAFRPNTTTGKTHITVVGGDSFSTVLAEVQTSLEAAARYNDSQFAVANYDGDNIPDIWRILPRGGPDGQPRLTVVSGADFLTPLAEVVLPLPATHTNMHEMGYSIADFDKDMKPDVWWVNRRTGNLQVISGADWTTVLYGGTSGARASSNLDWLVLGSDRARERILPQKPQPIAPVNGSFVTNPVVLFKPGGLTVRHTVHFYDAFGVRLVAPRQPKSWTAWCRLDCTVDPVPYGLYAPDGTVLQWEVQAVNAYGSTFSDRWTFTIDRPGAVTPIDPARDATATATPTFTWQTVPLATRYRLRIKPVGQPLLIKEVIQQADCLGGVCSFTTTTPLPPGNYQWRVQSFDGVGGVSGIPWQPFTVAVPQP